MLIINDIPLPTASGAVTTSGCAYVGFSVRNTSSTTPATIDLYDGSDTSGILFETISLAASESARENYPNPDRVTAIYAAITGTVAGTIKTG